ncbi:golgin subfamily A member 4 isoform X3 [Anolis carolinensis]|uniref:golgin subfamily A member 4 isoform X3 n=1 Tax=Anolis carolinensis TaxID=28377 RepID=UPI002F2B870C
MKTAKEQKVRMKEILAGSSSPGPKKKEKPTHEPQPMVIIPTVPTESMAKYTLALPSANKDRMLDEMDMLRNITSNLNEKEAYEDMTTFLICCTHLKNQLETALREEKQILESLLKWFEKEVQEMEEISMEQLIPDWEVPVADKTITANITKLRVRIQRLEDLKGRVQELPKLIQLSAPKIDKKKPPIPSVPKDAKHVIEELAMKHGTEDVMNMVQVFQDDTGQPQTIEVMNHRMLEIMKVFERQTNKLHRVSNEQEVLEGKLRKIQLEFQMLAEEKEIMEDELQKMKATEPDKSGDTRKKTLPKIERMKPEEKPPAAPERVQTFPTKQKEHQKMKEDLGKAQATIQSLENEKKMLEEKLQKVMEEAGYAKGQLAEIPPTTPDFQFPYKTIVEDDKDVPKKGKKPTKTKGKGEDVKLASSGTDRAVHKQQKSEPVKPGEMLPGKGQDLSETKPKRKVSGMLEKEPSPPTDKKEESKKMKAKAETADSKGVPKSKDSGEMKKHRKGVEKKHLPESKEVEKEKLIAVLDKSPDEMLSPDSKEQKTEITPSPELSTEEEGKVPSVILEKKFPRFHKDSVELTEDEVKDLVNKKMLQVADRLIALQGMPEAETLAKFLLEPGKGMEISDRQRLQLLDQLIIPDGLMQIGETDDEQTEKKRKLFGSIAATLQLLQEIHAPEDCQSEEERNEMAERRRVLFQNLKLDLEDLRQAQAMEDFKEDIDRKISVLSEKRSLLLERLESNMMELKEAQALAAIEPSEMNEYRVKELLQEREQLEANLEENLKDLHKIRTPKVSLTENAMEMSELTKQRSILLENLKSNLNELEEAEALAVTEPGSVSDEKMNELREQSRHLTALLETNEQDLQRAQVYAPGLAEQERELYKMHKLSEKKQLLLEKLESNQKELQEAQELEAIQPGSVSAHKLEELSEQRKHLTAELEATVDDMQNVIRYASEKAIYIPPIEKELSKMHKLSEKKQQLLEKLESNQKELQEAQQLEATQPGSVSAHRLEELSEQRKHLTAELEATMDDIQKIPRYASEKAIFISPVERELSKMHKLSEKKQQLLEKLESNQKELQEAQQLEATQPGSVSAHRLEELSEQRKHLTAELEATMDDIQKIPRYASEKAIFISPVERELSKMHKLSEKKQQLLEKLESNQKELQEAQQLEATQPGSVSAHRLEELSEQRKHLTAELEATMDDIQKIPRYASEKAIFISPVEKELSKMHKLSEKKQQLLEKLKSNQKELQEAQQLEATQPGSVSAHRLEELSEQRKHLTAELEATVDDIQKIPRYVSEKAIFIPPVERELSKMHKLSEKKQQLLEKLESNQKELQEAQHLAATQPGSVSAHRLEELSEQRKHLTEELEATVDDMQKMPRYASEKAIFIPPVERELSKMHKLSEKKQLLSEKLESNQKELQEAQQLAATQPGSVSAHRLEELSEQRKRLTADLEATVDDMQNMYHHVSERAIFVPPIKRDLSKIHKLAEKKQMLLEKLESNQKELQEAQQLEAAQPGSVSAHRLEELSEQRKQLTANLETTLGDIQNIYRTASEKAIYIPPIERELSKIHNLSEKKQLLLKKLESNQKELQEAQQLAATQPGSVSAHRLEELSEQRKQLTADLEATVDDMQNAYCYATERAVFVPPFARDLDELSETKQDLMGKLESNWKELQEAQQLAILQPGSISDHKLRALFNQRRELTEKLQAAVHDIEKEQRLAVEETGIMLQSGKELCELSAKKHELLEQMKYNQNELREAQERVATQRGSISESKLQEIVEQGKYLNEKLEETLRDLVKVERLASARALAGKPEETELYELSAKKQLLQSYLDSNWEALQEAQNLAITQPDSISEDKVRELAEERKQLTAELKTTMQKLQEVERRVSKKDLMERTIADRKLYDLFEKKQLLKANLESTLNELKEAQALEAAQPGSIPAKKLKELAQKRERLTEDLEKTVQDIQKTKLSSLGKGQIERPAERELYELSQKKQMLLENLKELQEAQALAATQPGIVGEEKRKELAGQKKRLAADLEATMHDIQKAQRASEMPETLIDREKELHELLEKKYLLLENLASSRKELQEAQALADAQPGSVSDHKLQVLAEQRKQLTKELKATVRDIQEIQRHASQRAPPKRPSRELFELSEKKQLLIESLESKQKELQEAQALEASQPGSIGESKLQELSEQKRRLAVSLEATVHDIREIQCRTSQPVIPEKPTEKDFHKLSEWKQLLLEHMESNLKELQEARALAATEPSRITERKIQELNEQRKILTENLEAVVQDMQEMKAHFSQTGAIIKPIEKDLNQLLQKKQAFLEHLKSNLEELQAAQKLAATHPDETNEQRIQDLTNERRLLAAGLEAIIQDLEKVQEVVGTRNKEEILEELSEKRRVILKDLASNVKRLNKAKVLAAAEPDDVNYQKVEELTEERRLLAVGLDAIMQEIKDLVLDTAGVLKPTERELDLFEKRLLFFENLTLNVEELKDLHAAANAEPGEQKKQELAEKVALLNESLETMLQEMQEEQTSDVYRSAMMGPDRKDFNDLIMLSSLESKLDELEESGTLSSIQLDGIRKKVRFLKEEKKKLIDKWQVPAVEQPRAYADDRSHKEKAVKEFIEQKKDLFSYLQSTIRDLEKKGIIQEKGIVREKGIIPDGFLYAIHQGFEDTSKEKMALHKYLMTVPEDLLEKEAAALMAEYGQADEKTAKQRALAAKLEANVKDLKAVYDKEKSKKKYAEPGTLSKRKMISEPVSQQQAVKPSLSGLRIQILKAPMIEKGRTGSASPYHRKSEMEDDTSVQEEQDISSQREIKLAYKRQATPEESRKSSLQYQEIKSFLPQLPGLSDFERNAGRQSVDIALQEILNLNKILGQKINLQQALQIAQQQLQQQQPYSQAERIRKLSLTPQLPGTTRFHEYPSQPSRPVWEASQLPQKDYAHKLNLLKRKMLGPEVKEHEIKLLYKREGTPEESKESLLQYSGNKTFFPQIPGLASSGRSPERPNVDIALQEILNFNMMLRQKAKLQKALERLQQQQQNYILAERIRKLSLLSPQPPGTARFHEYPTQPTRPVWEANQLPQRDYFHKLNLLRRKMLAPVMKAAWGAPASKTTSTPANQGEEKDSIAIFGKGWSPNQKQATIPAIKKRLR